MSQWYPEIMYEYNEDGTASKIPFIMIPEDREMPSLVYIFESRQTGEYEPGLEGEKIPMLEWELHQYADMAVLKEKLTADEYDNVRLALGLETMETAVRKGRDITSNIRKNIQEISPTEE